MVNKRILIGIAFLGVLMVWGALVQAAQHSGRPVAAPKAVFETTTLTFPTVVEGVVITHAFKIKNAGSADLRIDKVKTG